MKEFLIANSSQIILMTIFGGVALAMLVESLVPLRLVSPAQLRRWANNLALTAVDYAFFFSITPLLSLLILHTIGFEEPGLLKRLDVSPFASFWLILLCLEFVSYWLHRASHSLPLLWRIHAIHHSDPEMDATTAHRHHPFELVISTAVTTPLVIGLGVDPLFLLGYSVVHAVLAIFHHGNYSLGPSTDRILRWFIVTPDFHRLHHSTDPYHTDSNYAGIFPIFDYLFRTATQCSLAQQKSMLLGLNYFREAKYARLDQLLLLPFLQRPAKPPHG